MVYTDNTHMVADSLPELHAFAEKIGLKRHFFKARKKYPHHRRHPHYDLTNYLILKKAIDNGAIMIPKRELFHKALKMTKN